MTITSKLNEQQLEFWTLIQKINNCWSKGKPSELSSYFHKNVVFNSPDFKHQIVGKDNCIQTYIDFMNGSTVLLYSERNPVVNLFKDTVVAPMILK